MPVALTRAAAAPGHRDGGPHYWHHRGAQRPWWMAVRVPLVDVSQRNGPVELIPGTMEASIPEALERVRTGAAPVLRSVMRVGDVEVINPSTIHRGSPNRTHQPRCVLSFTFQPAAHEALGSPAARAEIEAGLLRPLGEAARRRARRLPVATAGAGATTGAGAGAESGEAGVARARRRAPRLGARELRRVAGWDRVRNWDRPPPNPPPPPKARL